VLSKKRALPLLQRFCGFEIGKRIPSKPTFSRSFTVMLSLLSAFFVLVTYQNTKAKIPLVTYSFVRDPNRVQYNNFITGSHTVLLDYIGHRLCYNSSTNTLALGAFDRIILYKNNIVVESLVAEGDTLVHSLKDSKSEILPFKHSGLHLCPSGWNGSTLYFYSEWGEESKAGFLAHENYFRWNTETHKIEELKDSPPYHQVHVFPEGLLLTHTHTITLMDRQGKVRHQWVNQEFDSFLTAIRNKHLFIFTTGSSQTSIWLLDTQKLRLKRLPKKYPSSLSLVAESDNSFLYSQYTKKHTHFYRFSLDTLQAKPLNIPTLKNRYYSLIGLSQDKKWLIVIYEESSPWPAHLMAISLQTGERKFLIESIVDVSIAP
jgi:hypothetical protein